MKVWVALGFCGLLISAEAMELKSYGEQALLEINLARAEVGVGPLVFDVALTAKSQEWAEKLAKEGKLFHRRPAQLIEFMQEYHWRGLSENLHGSPGAMEPKECIASWLKSPVHRRNLLNPQSRLAGLGVAQAEDGTVYVVFNGAG
jgi:uncharacterized protein YkwD